MKSILTTLAVLLCAAMHAPAANAIQKAAEPALKPAAVRWKDAAGAEPASFRRHVIPLMSRAGCSGRECHGAFSGQGGFALSLFGYDFDKDHSEIVNDAEDGSRIVREHPAKSLILTKPSLDDGETHKGKKRFEKGSWEYNMILRWIVDGAKLDVEETGEFDRLEVHPAEITFKRPGEKVQLRVLARWKDGTVEDVTQITRFRTNDESVADVSDTGLVTCKERGDTHVVAFYDNGVLPVPVMLPVGDPAKFPAVKARTKVDELVLGKLRKLGIAPSELCDDDDFLRRASLDATGTLPTPAEVEQFLADKAPDKRAKKIEELLARPGYAAWWATKMSDFTGNNSRQVRNVLQGGGRNLNDEVARQWYEWLRVRIADNMPYDRLAAGIVLATTRSSPEQSFEEMAREMSSYFRASGRADFAKRETLPWFWARNNVQKSEDKAMAFAHTFMGVRIECAQCHKHPFDQWTKQDFEQFQAFFAPVAYGERREKNDAPGTMTARSLRREIEDKAKAEIAAARTERENSPEQIARAAEASAVVLRAALGDMAAVPEIGRLAEQRRKQMQKLAQAAQDSQRRAQGETDKRLAAGEAVPWSELFVDLSRRAERPRDRKADVKGGSRVITPKLLGGGEVVLATYDDPRQPLMEWMRGQDNPYFAQAFVNRVWAGYFHRGLVEPADDLNLANPASNEAVLEYLSRGFVARGYDMKWLHREILNSDTYQRSWRTNETNRLDEKNFSRAVIRRLPAEVVFDALSMATSGAAKNGKFPNDMTGRAIGALGATVQPGGNGRQSEGYALAIFGKPARETNCDCERVTDPTLLQTIFTRNDQTVLRMLDDDGSWIGELRKAQGRREGGSPDEQRERIRRAKEKLAAIKAPVKPAADAPPGRMAEFEREARRHEERTGEYTARISEMERALAEAVAPKPVFDMERTIREIFLRTVSRAPTETELAQARADVAAAATPADGVRDLLWAMINTREFLVNR